MAISRRQTRNRWLSIGICRLKDANTSLLKDNPSLLNALKREKSAILKLMMGNQEHQQGQREQKNGPRNVFLGDFG